MGPTVPGHGGANLPLPFDVWLGTGCRVVQKVAATTVHVRVTYGHAA